MVLLLVKVVDGADGGVSPEEINHLSASASSVVLLLLSLVSATEGAGEFSFSTTESLVVVVSTKSAFFALGFFCSSLRDMVASAFVASSVLVNLLPDRSIIFLIVPWIVSSTVESESERNPKKKSKNGNVQFSNRELG